jgi:esterase/lipase superfamily enzyme
VVLLLLSLLAGCAGAPPPPAIASRQLTVIYVTDRAPVVVDRKHTFGRDWNGGTLTYGTARFDLPAHPAGQLQDGQPAAPIVIASPQDPAFWERAVIDALARAPEREMLVFVHGFNVPFDDDLFRAAQLATDTNFHGVVLTYDWASAGTVRDYVYDEDNCYKTIDTLTAFLDRTLALARAQHVQRVHLLGHSMGCRAITLALRNMVNCPAAAAAATATQPAEPAAPPFDQVVLMAADMDGLKFAHEDYPKIKPLAHRFSLYASKKDDALAASRWVHDDIRAGLAGKDIIVECIPGRGDCRMETIDVSAVEPTFFGHSYYAESGRILELLGEVLNDVDYTDQRLRPMLERAKKMVSHEERQYWLLRKT